jgi:putative ABC transport system permease protein
MKTLDRKLWRDLWHMKGQALAIAVVVASGTATFVMALSTLHSLRITRENFYREYRFSDVFASLKRAPESLRNRIADIPGVSRVETRVVVPVTIDVEGFPDPVSGQLVSVPDQGPPLLNTLYLREGRLPEAARDDEVVVSDAFAEAHGFHPGDQLRAVLNGRRKPLRIVGIGTTPEYVYQIAPGSIIPDFEGYGILWMSRTPLAVAYDLEGGFNNLVLTLSNGAQLPEVRERLDDLLQPYGGLGSYGRQDQISHRYLSEEFRQLEQMATIYPIIFLGVAAFLLNIVISRLVRTQREQIATLKAFGYRNLDVGIHYVKLAIVIVLAGVAGGVLIGMRFGLLLSDLYARFYRFPYLHYELTADVALAAALVSSLAALAGTTYSVWQAALRPPAQAMRPEPPARYRESFLERLGVKRWLSQPARIIVRNISRRPSKFALSAIAIAFSVAILMVGRFSEGSVSFMMKAQFGLAEREDLTVSFFEPASRRALHELRSLPGVEYGEVYRSVPVRLRFEHRQYRTSITGVEPGGDLYRLLDTELQPIRLPPAGIVLTDYLGQILNVRPGDLLTVEVLEGRRPTLVIPVAGLVHQFIGVSAYMNREALNRVLREGDSISGVYLAVDARYRPQVYATLKEMPRIAGTVVREKALQNFYDTMAEQVLTFALIATLFAGSIAFGVVYNTARIALSERSRELASLRVLGFTRGEISYILLGELAVLTLAAIPLGFLIGRGLCAYVIRQVQTDLFRIPLVLEPSVYAFAATAVLASAALSGLIVRKRLDHLDLVAVLKMKE